MKKIKCPYWKICKNYDKTKAICRINEGFFGVKFRADECLHKK